MTMKNILKSPLAVAAFALAFTLPVFIPPAFAIEGDSARFDQCQQLKSSGSLNWYGIASGTIDSTFAIFENSRSFHTRACFATERQCRTWVKRIWWEIPTLDELEIAYCKPA